MKASTNSINWFEISVADINRAPSFYSTIFDITMDRQEMMGMHMAFFPWENGSGKANGALVQGDMYVPSADGVKLYLNADPDLQVVLDRIQGAGGQIVMAKTAIGDGLGYMAFFVDTEGNVVGLHSNA